MWTEGIFKGCAQTHATGPAGDDRQKKAKEPSLAADVALCVCAQYFFFKKYQKETRPTHRENIAVISCDRLCYLLDSDDGDS